MAVAVTTRSAGLGPAVFPIQPPLIGVPFVDPASGLLSPTGRKTVQRIVNAISGSGGVGESMPAIKVADFGQTGTADDTSVFSQFFTFAAANPGNYWIPPATYNVQGGFVMQSPSTTLHTQAPMIYTGGRRATIFNLIGNVDQPFLTISNNVDPAHLRFVFFHSGYLGGFAINDLSGVRPYVNRHGMVQFGLWGWWFDDIMGNSLFGDLLHVPSPTIPGVGEDAYSINYCHYKYLETDFSPNYSKVINNTNGNALSFNTFHGVRSVRAGGIVSGGSGNTYRKLSMLQIKGWAFDAGTGAPSGDGGGLKEVIEGAELDTCEFGIRLPTWQKGRISECRMDWAASFDPVDAGVQYPKIALQIGDSTLIPGGGLVNDCDISIVHRFSLAKSAARGVIGDFQNNPNIKGLTVKHSVFLTSQHDAVAADCFTNINASAKLKGYFEGVLGWDSSGEKTAAWVPASGAATLAKSAGYGTAASKVVWGGTAVDPLGIFDAANNQITIPYPGLYHFLAQMFFAGLAAATNVRMVFVLNRGGVISTFGENPSSYAVAAQNLTVRADGYLRAQVGDLVYVSADNSSGADQAVAASPAFGDFANDNYFQVEITA